MNCIKRGLKMIPLALQVGFPINVQGQVLGAICVSGLVQEEDHQIVTEAIANIKAIQHI